MNRRIFHLAVLLLGLLLGFGASQWFQSADHPPSTAPDETPAPPDGETPRENTPPTANTPNRDDPTPPPTAENPATPLRSSTNAHLALAPPPSDETVLIPRKFLSRIQCPVFNTASNCVTDDIAELLHIAPEERQRLDRLIAATRSRVEADELDRATVTEQSSTRVVLKIAANPEAGRDIEKDYLAGVQEVLGDRSAVFLERARVYDSTQFSNFGRNDTTLTVTRDENSNLLRVQSRQEYSTPGGSGSSTSITMTEQMPARWKKFFQAP
ncbi:MAG: hypothetical protein WCR06_05415 [bacterium]